MWARLRKLLIDLRDTFWVLPALLVLAGLAAAEVAIRADTADWGPDWLKAHLYSGGETGARTLLGAIASSTIGVTGTLFSITIAALTLASSQMGPRLLDNFTRDRGNQVTLGVFLGAFAYALLVLRQVRGGDDDVFVPQIALAGAMVLALLCVALLVYFVQHISTRINIDTVIELVRRDLFRALDDLTEEAPEPPPRQHVDWSKAVPICDDRHGYLQQIDEAALADWACAKGICVRLLVRHGDFLTPGGVLALVSAPVDGATRVINRATAVGGRRSASGDLEYSVRQLVEVAVRALSPGVNDPMTAMTVLDQLGAALCRVSRRHLPNGVTMRDGTPVLVRPTTDYEGLTAAMFDMIRQSGAMAPAVLIRMLDVLALVAEQERRPSRLKALRRHADLVLADGRRNLANRSDLKDLSLRHRRFRQVAEQGGPARRAGFALL